MKIIKSDYISRQSTYFHRKGRILTFLKMYLAGITIFLLLFHLQKAVCYHSPIEFAVNVKEGQDKLPTLYWLPKLHKIHTKHGLLQIRQGL